MSADANLAFQTWLEDVTGGAASGHLDTWQESFGEASFVRLHAGGREEMVEAPFPVPHRPRPTRAPRSVPTISPLNRSDLPAEARSSRMVTVNWLTVKFRTTAPPTRTRLATQSG